LKGIASKTKSVVASRADAMAKKRQTFYFGVDGSAKVREGLIIQAHVVAVAEKVIRVEIFGAECSIVARDLSWDWLGDAGDFYSVGGQILVQVQSVKLEAPDKVTVKADVKSVTDSRDDLKKCRVQGKYAGRVTDIRKGVVFVRLAIGVNAVAHSCYGNRVPGKKDDVSFVVTHLDEERNVAVGIITRTIRRNI
jgi:ribosomal protein S1